MNDSYRFSNLQRTQTNVPWFTFLFLALVFFVAGHDLFFSIQEQFDRSAEYLVKAIIEGSIGRRVVFLMLGLYGVIGLMRQGLNRIKINGFLGWLILFYIFWSFLSIAWAEDIALTFRRLVVLAMLCLGALAVSNRFSLRDIILFALLSTSFYLLIGLVAEIAVGTFRPFEPGYRFTGTLHPNQQGLNCSLLVLSSITAFQSVKRGRILLLACMLIGLIFLVLTKSRTPFVSAILALFVYWALLSSSSRKIALILGVSVTFCLLLLVVGDALFPVLRQGVLLGREDISTYTLTGRIPLWKECLEYVAKRPFLGYGYNNFWTPRRISEISDRQGWGIAGSCSAYLELLLGLGIVGMVAYVLILVVGIRRSFVNYRASLNTGYAFLGVLLIFYVLDSLLEAGNVDPALITFVSWVALARLGFQRPQRYKELAEL